MGQSTNCVKALKTEKQDLTQIAVCL